MAKKVKPGMRVGSDATVPGVELVGMRPGLVNRGNLTI